MMMRIASALLPLALGVAAAAAPPESKSAATGEIVVTGQKALTPAETRHLVASIALQQQQQLARFAAPVCVLVDGFADAYNDSVADRIREDARDAGIPVDREGCRPNVTVVIVENGQRMLKEMVAATPRRFDGIDHDVLKKALADPGPVHVLWSVHMAGADGEQETTQTPAGMSGGKSGAGEPIPYLTIHSVSIINQSIVQQLTGNLLIVDKPAILGKTLHQVADYAAMRLLAQTLPPKQNADTTILGLFATDTTPRGLTAFDASYLKALYRSAANRTAIEQEGAIARQIRKRGEAGLAPASP